MATSGSSFEPKVVAGNQPAMDAANLVKGLA